VEYLMSLLMLLSLANPSSKLHNRFSHSGAETRGGHYTQTGPPPLCDPTAQNCN